MALPRAVDKWRAHDSACLLCLCGLRDFAAELWAQALGEARADLRLPPATIICRYDGWLGLSPLTPEEEAGIFQHIEDALDDTRWQRFGIWQLFFCIQWAVFTLALLRQLIASHGGI